MEYKTTDHNEKDVEMLLTKFLDESVFDGKVIVENVKKIIKKTDEFLTIVVYDDKPVAIFMGYTYQHPFFSGASLSDDMLFYVVPEYRGSMIAIRLIKKYIKWAEQKGVKYIQLGQATGTGDVFRIGKFFEGLGFKTVGVNCLKEI